MLLVCQCCPSSYTKLEPRYGPTDPSIDIFVGSVDVLHNKTGYALVLSIQTCFVWKIDMVCCFFHLPKISHICSPTHLAECIPPPNLLHFPRSFSRATLLSRHASIRFFGSFWNLKRTWFNFSLQLRRSAAVG